MFSLWGLAGSREEGGSREAERRLHTRDERFPRPRLVASPPLASLPLPRGALTPGRMLARVARRSPSLARGGALAARAGLSSSASSSANPSGPARNTEPDENTPVSKVLDRLADVALLTDMFRGITITAENFVRDKVTINYPFEKGPISPRFRGEHALRRYPNGEERCESSCSCSCPCSCSSLVARDLGDATGLTRPPTPRHRVLAVQRRVPRAGHHDRGRGATGRVEEAHQVELQRDAVHLLRLVRSAPVSPPTPSLTRSRPIL